MTTDARVQLGYALAYRDFMALLVNKIARHEGDRITLTDLTGELRAMAEKNRQEAA